MYLFRWLISFSVFQAVCGLAPHWATASPRTINQFGTVTGRQMPARMAGGITIDKPTTIKSPVRQVAPPDESTNTRGGGGAKYRVVLFNDPVNTKEFVARALMNRAGLDEGSAFQVRI